MDSRKGFGFYGLMLPGFSFNQWCAQGVEHLSSVSDIDRIERCFLAGAAAAAFFAGDA